MELTLESALSPGGVVGNLSYILLILSMAMRRIFWLRSLAILSGLTGIAYDLFWLSNPVGVFWETSFTLTNLIQWLLLVHADRKMRLTPDEQALWQKYFSKLTRHECKQLLDASKKIVLPAGGRLIKHGDMVTSVFVLIRGRIDICLDGETVSSCQPGDLLGEMSFLTGEPASADSIASMDCELLEVAQSRLSSLIKAQPEFGLSMTRLISLNIAGKLKKQSALSRLSLRV